MLQKLQVFMRKALRVPGRMFLRSRIRRNRGRSGYVCNKLSRVAIMARVDAKLQKEQLFLESRFTIDSLARNVGTNRTYLSQSIKMERGLSFSDYINSFRIGYAKQYIIERIAKDSSVRLFVDDIAMIAGFGSKRNFVRQFRKIEGVTPMQCIKRLRSGCR